MQPGCTSRRSYGRKALIKSEVERQLTGKEKEPGEIIYFKLYKIRASSLIERALETASLMLGTDKSRGYSLEMMICADFLAGANADGANPEVLMLSLRQIYRVLPLERMGLPP